MTSEILDHWVTALLVLIGTIVTAYFGYRGSKTAQQVKTEVATNHGKRSGEYIEAMYERIIKLHENGEEQNRRLDSLSMRFDLVEQLALKGGIHHRELERTIAGYNELLRGHEDRLTRLESTE